jgi:hypothetical protein
MCDEGRCPLGRQLDEMVLDPVHDFVAHRAQPRRHHHDVRVTVVDHDSFALRDTSAPLTTLVSDGPTSPSSTLIRCRTSPAQPTRAIGQIIPLTPLPDLVPSHEDIASRLPSPTTSNR